MQFNAIIEKDDNGYFAYVPELKGCYSQGETFEETISNINEAAELYIDSLNQEEKDALLKKSIFIAPLELKSSKVI